MKNTKLITMLCLGALIACSPSKKGLEPTSEQVSPRERLIENLRATPQKGIMFGHHDDTVYGIGWEFDEGGSDVQKVCGDYPAVISFDLGEIELGGDKSLDKVPFEKIRKEIINQYNRGGLASLSWHPRNPKTGGDAWDVSDHAVVKSILPEGENYEKFQSWLGKVNDFILSLKTSDGTKIPVLFRPWHEHTGSWFWWGQNLCTTDEYKALWRMTADYLNAHGAADQIVYAYSTGTEPRDQASYLERYPGHDLIDVLGFDAYQREDKDFFLKSMDTSLSVIDSIGKANHKIIAITETGYEGVPDSTWWTGTLLPAMEKYPVAYVLVWRNAREKVTHFFGPYPGQASAEEFKKFFENPKTLFASDINLYK